MRGLIKVMTPPADSILPFERDDDNRATGMESEMRGLTRILWFDN